MSRVIHKIKSILLSLLHRSLKAIDSLFSTGLLQKTLGASSRLRCGNYITRQKHLRIAGFTSALSLAVLSVFFVYPIVKNLNSAEAATAQDSTTTLSITSGASANVSLLVKDSAGTFAKSTNDQLANFSVTTNNGSGYKLVIKGGNSTYSNLTNAATNTSLSSISSAMSESSFESYTLSSNQGIWGYKPSKLNGSNNTSYKGAPNNTTGDTIDTTSAANSTANSYTIGLGVKANYATKAGTYTNTYVLTAVGNGTPYSITYADNTSDASYPVSNLPARQYSDTGITATSVTLTSSTPTRTGYTFRYWCEGTVSNNGTTCSGTTYNAEDSYGIDRQSSSNSTTLYAVWSPTITIKSVDGLTNVSLNGTSCTNTSTGCTVTGLVYNTSYNLVATIANTNKHSFTSWTKSNTATGTGTIAANSASTTYIVGSLPITITPTLTVKKYTCTKQYRQQTATGTWGSYTTDSTEQVDYGATCSYSKTVANYTGVEGTNSQAATASGTMNQNGLTLQVSLYRNTYTVSLTKGTGISAVTVTGTGVKSGSGTASATVYYGGTVTIAATLTSSYSWVNWTGSATYTNQSQSISSVTSSLSFTANGASSCQTTVGGNMQDFNPCDTITATSGSLTDSRDNQTYTVAKINGNWWMTRNLAIGCNGSGTTYSATIKSRTLSSSNSNVSSYTTPTSSGHSNTYTEGKIVCNATYGAWYNYYAATGGTISGDSNETDATSDICPKGWRLPTNSEQSGITSYKTQFSPVTGGLYSNGSLSSTGYGYWWSATSYSSTARYTLYYNGSSLGTRSYGRYNGFYVRCIRSS